MEEETRHTHPCSQSSCYEVNQLYSHLKYWLTYGIYTNLAVVSSCLDVLWVEGHARYTRETVERDKPSSVAVLDTFKPGGPGKRFYPHGPG